jgi:CMP-N-acetylneuraminic acid synthetase
VLPFNGKPLIQWTVDNAKAWASSTYRIAISTNLFGILNHGIVTPAHYVHLLHRPYDLCQDDTPKLDVLRHAVKFYEKKFLGRHGKYDPIIDLDITNPCRTPQDIENCFRIFEKNRPKTLYSVTKARKNPQFNMVFEDGKLCVEDAGITRMQDTPKAYDLNSCIYIYDRDWLMDESNLHPVTDRSEFYVMPDYAGVDIDTKYDFEVSEMFHKKYYLETTKD